jgi:hypothetical protein
MSEAALTITSLLHTPALQSACGLWLKSRRYALVRLNDNRNPLDQLRAQREAVDAVLLEQDAWPSEIYQQLREEELLFPAVVIGEVTGKTPRCTFLPTNSNNCLTAWMRPLPAS